MCRLAKPCQPRSALSPQELPQSTDPACCVIDFDLRHEEVDAPLVQLQLNLCNLEGPVAEEL